MSEPDIPWHIGRIKDMLEEIDKLVREETMTNSKREIITFNTNEVWIHIYAIIRQLKDAANRPSQAKVPNKTG